MTANQQRATNALTTLARITALNPDTERNLHDSLAGWPTEPPSSTTTRAVTLDATGNTIEPAADGIPHDQARADLELYSRLMLLVAVTAERIEYITRRWAYVRLDDTAVAKRIADADQNIWCVSHLRYGAREVRTHGQRCEFCASVHAKYGADPTRELLDYKARHRTYPHDIARLMKAARKARSK